MPPRRIPTRAAVCYYATDIHKGFVEQDWRRHAGQRWDIKGELLMFWGKTRMCRSEGRKKIYNALCELNVNFPARINGQHAFIRDEGHRYDPARLRCNATRWRWNYFIAARGGDFPVAPSGPAESKH